jgi:Protein of unknown function (DUF4446)
MTFSQSTLSLLALIAVGLAVLAIGFTIADTRGGRGRTMDSGGPVSADDALVALLEGHTAQISRVEQAVRALNATDRRQQDLIDGSVRRVALFRYDAFEDVGGRLSFSCALLDDRGSGVVLTSINGRQETRVYAKPVADGRSGYNLSLEEEEAIRQAMASTPTPDQKPGQKPNQKPNQKKVEAR